MRYSTWLVQRNGGRIKFRFSPSPLLRVGADNGFTLIEVLVAFLILSIVIAALYSTFFVSRRAIDSVDDSLIRLQEARAVVDTLRKELEASLYSKEKEYAIFKLSDRDFYGRQASQAIFTSFSGLLPGLSKITYTVEEKEGVLVLKKEIVQAFTKPASHNYFGLIEDIGSFTIEARYNDQWVKTWDSSLSNSIPDEIRISIKIAPKKREGMRDNQVSRELITISETARPRPGRPI